MTKTLHQHVQTELQDDDLVNCSPHVLRTGNPVPRRNYNSNMKSQYVLSRVSSQGFVPHLDLSFGAGLAADRADHVAAVHLNQLFIQAQNALVPGSDVDVVKNTGLHMLEVHNLIPESG